jgi:very-short-patch-repair endonuclease
MKSNALDKGGTYKTDKIKKDYSKSSIKSSNKSKESKTSRSDTKEKNIKCINDKYIEQQKRYTNMGLGNLSYDFYLPEKNILIECDGQQHFKECPNYFHRNSSFNYQRIRDVRKNAFALKSIIPLLRIAYTEEKFINSILTAFILRVERGFKGIVFSNYKLYKRR